MQHGQCGADGAPGRGEGRPIGDPTEAAADVKGSGGAVVAADARGTGGPVASADVQGTGGAVVSADAKRTGDAVVSGHATGAERCDAVVGTLAGAGHRHGAFELGTVGRSARRLAIKLIGAA